MSFDGSEQQLFKHGAFPQTFPFCRKRIKLFLLRFAQYSLCSFKTFPMGICMWVRGIYTGTTFLPVWEGLPDHNHCLFTRTDNKNNHSWMHFSISTAHPCSFLWKYLSAANTGFTMLSTILNLLTHSSIYSSCNVQ